MLAIGAALEHSGAVSLIVEAVAPVLTGLPPFLLVWAVYLLTSVLTELVSNNAVAVVVTPIAIGLAAAMGIDPRPLVIAVMVAASASFATRSAIRPTCWSMVRGAINSPISYGWASRSTSRLGFWRRC